MICVAFLGKPLYRSVKIMHNPYGEGGLHLQVPKPNLDGRCIGKMLRFLEWKLICVVVLLKLINYFHTSFNQDLRPTLSADAPTLIPRQS